MNRRIKRDWLSQESNTRRILDACVFPAGLVVIYVVFDLILGGGALLNLNAFLTLISHTTIQAFIGWGLVFIFSGGPDFSVAGAFIIAANVAAASVVEWNMGYFGIFFFSIIITVLLQLFSVFVRLKCKLPTWVSGLGMLMIYESIGSVYTSARSARGLTNYALGADQCRSLGLHPIPLILLIVGTVVMYIVYSRTKIGIEYRAVSSNARVAGYMGISGNRTQYVAAAVGAVSVGIAVACTISSNARVDTYTGLGSVAVIGKALATWLLAGAMEKRLSKPICILLGAFFTAFLFNVMTRMNIPSGTWQDVANAVFILIFGMLSFAGTKEVIK